jgi:hypothetical protein
VHEVSRRVWGLRLRRTEQELALALLLMLPTANVKDGGELSSMLFHNMSSSETTGNSSAALTQYFTEDTGLQRGIKVSAFPSYLTLRF